MLTVDGATRELLAAGLIDLDAVFEGDLTIQNVSRRNRNLRVVRNNGPSLLVKQANPASDEGTESTLRSEIGFYKFIQEVDLAKPIRHRFARLIASSIDPATLYIELLAEHKPLWRAYTGAATDELDPRRARSQEGSEANPKPVPVGIARALGTSLGCIHAMLSRERVGDHPRLQWLHDSAPWILRIHKPGPTMLAQISSANIQTVRILQEEPGLSGLLDSTRDLWEPTVIVHGDVKSDNVLARAVPDRDEPDVRFVDWELVQWGDPAWDVGGVLQDFVCYWIHHIPLTSEKTPEEMVTESTLPLSHVQPASRGFWHAYVKAAGLDRSQAREQLLRSMRFSAARLVQTAYEFGNTSTGRLPNQSVAMLQVAANILHDPEIASLHLYGIPPGIELDHASLGTRHF